MLPSWAIQYWSSRSLWRCKGTLPHSITKLVPAMTVSHTVSHAYRIAHAKSQTQSMETSPSATGCPVKWHTRGSPGHRCAVTEPTLSVLSSFGIPVCPHNSLIRAWSSILLDGESNTLAVFSWPSKSCFLSRECFDHEGSPGTKVIKEGVKPRGFIKIQRV